MALVGSISGMVFNDLNASGVFEPLAGEVGAAGRTVFLDSNNNGALDAGEVSQATNGSGNYSFAGLADGPYSVRVLLDPVTEQTRPTFGPPLPPQFSPQFVALANAVDHVYDINQAIEYISTSVGTIERFDVRKGELLAPLNVGIKLGGLDITPDGRFIYVAEQQPGTTQSMVRKVDTTTGEVTNLTFDRVGLESGSFDVVILNNGKAFFTTLRAAGPPAGTVPLREINLLTDAISIRGGLIGASDLEPMTRMNRNSNRSAVVFTESGAASGPVFFYKTSTESFTARMNLVADLTLAPAAISRDGSLAAVQEPGAPVQIIDTTTLSVVQTIAPSQRGGAVFDPNRDLLYLGNDGSDTITAYSTATFFPQFSFSIGQNIDGAAAYSQLGIAADGKRLFLTTLTGVREYPLFAPIAINRTVAGNDITGVDFGIHIISNVQPTARADYYQMGTFATTLTVSDPEEGVLPNDADPNLNQSLVARLVRQARHGFVALDEDGTFVFTANATLDVKDTFEYVVNDGVIDSAPITVTISRGANRGASISGVEFRDLDGNGVYEPGQGETPIVGEEVYLDVANNGVWDPPRDPILTTGADGSYTFAGLPAGTYHVRALTPAGNRPTWPVAPVDLGTLLPLTGVADFLHDPATQILYVARTNGTILRYSLLTSAYLAPLAVPGVPAAIERFGAFLYVADSQEVSERSFIHKVSLVDGTVTTIGFDTPAEETAPVDIAFAANGKAFITTERSADGLVPLRELNANTGAITSRTVPVGSGGGTIADGTRITRTENYGQLLFQEGNLAGDLFLYDAASDQFINGPAPQVPFTGTHAAFTKNQGGLIAAGQFGPSVFDTSYEVKEVFSDIFNAGLGFNVIRPILYAADSGANVLIGLDTRTFQELFRVVVGENLAATPIQRIVLSPDAQNLFIATPAGIRMFNIALPGVIDVALAEDTSVGGINFGQEVIPTALYVDVPGGMMSEEQGPGALRGILTRTGPDLSQQLFVNLTSSNPGRAAVPSAVLIPAGAASVTFPIDAVDNTLFDAVLTVVITASATGVGSNSDFIVVQDHEIISLTLANESIAENGGSTTATITRSNSNTGSPLVVTLSSSDPSEATIPTTATIPANASSVTVPVTAVDDAIFDGSRPVVFSASAAGYFNINDSLTIVSDLDSYRNILVTTTPSLHNMRLREYSPVGTQVGDLALPVAPGGDEPVHDVVVDGNGNVQLYNGTVDPSLSTFDPRRGSFQHHTEAGWSTAPTVPGGIAAFGNFVFVTDMSTGAGDDLLQGLIRFNTIDFTAVRFATTFNFVDVAVGLDGLVYGLEGSNLQVFNPTTLAFVRTVTLAGPTTPLAIAVGAAGQIYGVAGDNRILRFASDGTSGASILSGGNNLNDLDISPLGQLVAGGMTGSVVLADDPDHDLPTNFQAGTTQAMVAFGNLNRADGLTLSVRPTTFLENAGTAASAATVTRPSLADLSVSLTVSLAISDTSEATVQQIVTIPSGRVTANFNIRAVNDSLGDGPQNVVLTAVAPGQIGAAANLTVLDDEVNYLLLSFAPSSMSENGGSLTGTVSRVVADNSSALVINLASNDETEATIPATVTILANQNSATFTVTAVDDAIRDATQTVTITASAAGLTPASGEISVTDDEPDSISLNIVPATISEGGGTATGTVTRTVGDNSQPMTVNLSSSDTTEATVPPSVTIPAGQNSVNFAVTGVDDAIRDGTQAVVVTATASGVAAANAGVSVSDNELDFLSIALADPFMFENGGSLVATLSRFSLDNSQALVVNLASNDATEASVPATVTIPANQDSASFTISAVDDLISDGPQIARITASVAGYNDSNQNVRVGDNERPYQNQRNVLDVDPDGLIISFDALVVINIINIIGTGPADEIMAQYSGPTVYPDTDGDNFISAIDALLVINDINIDQGQGGEAEGEGDAEIPLEYAATGFGAATLESESSAATLAFLGDDWLPGRTKLRRAELDELVLVLAAEQTRRKE